jgi:hypothetical protein
VLVTNHVLAGALIGSLCPGPASAFVTGVASHVLMDMTPHWGDEDLFLPVAVVDGLVGATALVLVSRSTSASRRTRVTAGMLGAAFPDLDKPSRLFLGRSPFPTAVDDWHKRVQRESPRRLPQEIVVAALTGLAVRAAVLGGGVLSRRSTGRA